MRRLLNRWPEFFCILVPLAALFAADYLPSIRAYLYGAAGLSVAGAALTCLFLVWRMSRRHHADGSDEPPR